MSQGEVDVTSISSIVGRRRHRPSSLDLSSMGVQFKGKGVLGNEDNKKEGIRNGDPGDNSPVKGGNSPVKGDNSPIKGGTNTKDTTTNTELPAPRPSSISSNTISAPNPMGDQHNSNLALRIVSPGLPQLSDQMKNTVRLSHQIHLQQKTIIAARNNNSDEPIGDNEEEGDDGDNHQKEDDQKEHNDNDKNDNDNDDHDNYNKNDNDDDDDDDEPSGGQAIKNTTEPIAEPANGPTSLTKISDKKNEMNELDALKARFAALKR